MENLVSKKDQENDDMAAFDYRRCHKCWKTRRALNCWPVEIERPKCSREFVPVRAVEDIGIPSGRVTVSYHGVAAPNQPLKGNPPDRFLETYKVAKKAGLLDVV